MNEKDPDAILPRHILSNWHQASKRKKA